MIAQKYVLDMVPGGIPPRVHVSQNDADSRAIMFTLYSGAQEFEVPDGAVVTCDGAKPDGKAFSYVAAAAGNVVSVNVTTQMTAAKGVVICQITVNQDGAILGSANFEMVVEASAMRSGELSQTEMQSIEQLVGDAAANAQLAKDAYDGIVNVIAEANQTIINLNSANNLAAENISSLDSKNATAAANIAALTDENFKALEILTGVEDIKAYLGYLNDDIVGISVDYENGSFQRLAGAYNLSAGSDFDSYAMFGGRKRCNVADDGTINAYYGDEGYAEDGSNGQVMVYQPAFYYKVVPLKTEKQSDGIGYHLRKANYYVSTKAKTGFKLHPAFIDLNGNEVDYILLSAYEAVLWDADAGDDGTGAWITDGTNYSGQTVNTSVDKLGSVAGCQPISYITRPNLETLANNRGANWHNDMIKTESANQLLMLIEMGTMNLQTAIANGVVSIADNASYNCSSVTGSTSDIGNGTGRAASTTDYTGAEQTANGKTSVVYRGVENPWGNIWKSVCGINIHGDGTQKGGIPHICTDYNFAESKMTGNYESAGFALANVNGYISAMGYGSEDYDWLLMPSEATGNSSTPVGDYFYCDVNLNGYRTVILGGGWNYNVNAGGFCWHGRAGVGGRDRNIGGRLVYVPTKDSDVYSAAIASWDAQQVATKSVDLG